MEEMKRAFRPEFLNRIDDIIVFHALAEQHIKSIISLMITRINKQLTEKGIELILTPTAENALLEKGYDRPTAPGNSAGRSRSISRIRWRKPSFGANSSTVLVSKSTWKGATSCSAKRRPRPPMRRSSLLSTDRQLARV